MFQIPDYQIKPGLTFDEIVTASACISKKLLVDDLSIKEAEHEAQQLKKLYPNPQPRSSDWDPLSKVKWTFPMALAWIIWRDVELVRLFWREYISSCRNWGFEKVYDVDFDGGPGLTALRPLKFSSSLLSDFEQTANATANSCFVDPSTAPDELWSKLLEGQFMADGISRTLSKRIEIPAYEFADLRPKGGRCDFELDALTIEKSYRFPLLAQKDIKKIWSIHSTKSQRCTNHTEELCKEWLIEQMRASPNQRPYKQDVFFEHAREQPGMATLSKEAFKRAWSKAIETTGVQKAWRRPGPTQRSTDA